MPGVICLRCGYLVAAVGKAEKEESGSQMKVTYQDYLHHWAAPLSFIPVLCAGSPALRLMCNAGGAS